MNQFGMSVVVAVASLMPITSWAYNQYECEAARETLITYYNDLDNERGFAISLYNNVRDSHNGEWWADYIRWQADNVVLFSGEPNAAADYNTLYAIAAEIDGQVDDFNQYLYQTCDYLIGLNNSPYWQDWTTGWLSIHQGDDCYEVGLSFPSGGFFDDAIEKYNLANGFFAAALPFALDAQTLAGDMSANAAEAYDIYILY